MRPEKFREELEKQERAAFNNFLGVFGDLCIGEKIRLTGEETDKGLVLRLKTEWAALGIPPDGFVHPEIRIGFYSEKSSPRLLYKECDLVTSDFYQACAFLVEDLIKRERDSHHKCLFGFAEHAILRYIRRGRTSARLPRVYAMCAKFIPHLPTFEDLEQADLPRIRQMLIEEEQKLQTGGCCRIYGGGFFKSIQWDNKEVRTYALDPIDVYETGEPDSMQFREDLERYAKLADKTA